MDHHNHHDYHDHKTDTSLSGGEAKKPEGIEIIMAENRDIENNSNISKSVVVNHVWETCKPNSNFVSKSPTVSVRRIQLMRSQLQTMPKDWNKDTGSVLDCPLARKKSSSGYATKKKPSLPCPDIPCPDTDTGYWCADDEKLIDNMDMCYQAEEDLCY